MRAFDRLASWSPLMLAALRVMTALLFIEHGTAKLFGFPADPNVANIPLFSLIGLAGILEVFGGFLILIGLCTRPVAFVLAGFMAVAYFMAHAPKSFFPLLNNGDAAILFCFIFLYLMVAGPGSWSIDSLKSPEPIVTTPTRHM
ncbi:MAG: DoxX family protein [Alphaproteobacteria bacterium]|nr:DoxX family protein [Alphaproteobacteria bacterium]